MNEILVLNESDQRAARKTVERIDALLTGRAAIEASQRGLSDIVWNSHRRALERRRNVLSKALERYERARETDPGDLLEVVGNNPGLALIVARISAGLSQKEFARRVGLKEQQVQRYEADRYRSISLSNYERLARSLGVVLRPTVPRLSTSDWVGTDFLAKYPADAIRKLLRHARSAGWFGSDSGDGADAEQRLAAYLNDAHQKFGSPALLRTSKSVSEIAGDFSLLGWRARVTDLFLRDGRPATSFDPADIAWVQDLIKLSAKRQGPLEASAMLRSKGIGFVYEPQVPGLKLDGAAFLISDIPVIALTLRYDRVDYFWFTLLHELGHVFLHLDLGMAAGFFDDFEENQTDEFESEADCFAAETIVAADVWRRSPARISKVEKPFYDLSSKLGINPALLFGKARRERQNYKIFSDKLGHGSVRVLFASKQEDHIGD